MFQTFFHPIRFPIAGLIVVLLSGAALAVESPRSLSVTTVTVAMRPILAHVPVTGTIVAREEVLVAPEIDHLRIVEILAEAGDHVKKGQILARLSRDTLQAELTRLEAAQARLNAGISQADANRTQAEAALRRSQSLRETGNASQEQLDQRTASARATEAAVRMAEAQRFENEAQIRDIRIRLARTEVKAPAAGIVSKRSAKIGAQASSAAEPLFRIIADGALEMNGEVPENRFGQLRPGQRVEIDLPDGQRIEGRIRLLSPSVNALTRLGSLRVALPVDAPALLGNFAFGTVITDEKTALVVPTTALSFGVETTAHRVKDGQIETRALQIGIQDGNLTEILSGLAEGDEIVAKAGSFLRQGDRVHPQSVPLESVLNSGNQRK